MTEAMAPVCVVDDDPSVLEAVASLIRSAGLKVDGFSSAQAFLAAPRPLDPSCLVLDVQMPGLGGLDLQRELATTNARIPIVFLTGHGDVPTSVRAMKAGAVEFLTKPFDAEDLLAAVRHAIALRAEPIAEDIGPARDFEELIGGTDEFRRALKLVETVAPTDATVLIRGETGTGKELIARAVHQRSKRRDRPFVKLNCASIPSGLLESELFGHERGAFTGAIAARPGRFELANGGTLFLDEIGDIPAELQPKLLRVLQEQEFERLGSSRTIRSDVRLVAATNRDLESMIEDGEFRSDLYYRLNVFPVTLPPLRERRGDIAELARYMTRRIARRIGKRIDTIPESAIEALRAHDWPGNVRELENVIERAVILSSGPSLEVPVADLRTRRIEAPAASDSLRATVEATERDAIVRALQESQGVVSGAKGAAARLGMKRSTLQSRMSRLGIRNP